MGRLFGTDGVRGVANSELTPELAFALGKAGAYVLSQNKEKPVFVTGADTRISGDMLENALSAGILAVGGNVIKAGILPTPAIAYLVRQYKADAGVMISASHNPFEYNGIKFFNGRGFKLDDEIEDQIEEIIVRNIDVNSHITGDRLGKRLDGQENAADLYTRFLLGTAPDLDLHGLRIVLDCANGASYKIAENVYRELGAELILIGNEPNGFNINDHCGSTHPQQLQQAVVENDAYMGMAFDGDADRLIAVDDRGGLIDGDRLMCICARQMKEEGRLPGSKVTATVMSNIGLHKYMREIGCSVDVTAVGDRYVLESMLRTGCRIGGEQSGHMIFLDHTTTGDGILSSLQLLRAVIDSDRRPSEVAAEIEIYPQVLRNAKVQNKNKQKFKEDEEIQQTIAQMEADLSGDGRILIRPSGTEPLVRVMIEGTDTVKITRMAEDMAEMLEEKFG
ncbi:MAG: phosphoglucosamine mutase [Anaerovoracaceae bacterium]|jgi:phosphoglucosamine mutase